MDDDASIILFATKLIFATCSRLSAFDPATSIS